MVDVTDATFQTAVIERSMTVPVVVDLWAEWCGPCKQLGPIIERAVAATDGQVELAKVDVDANPNVANAFRVQSIPAVFAIKDGRPVDQFIGAQPEAEVVAFVEKLVPPKELSETERLVLAGDEASLQAALELEPDHAGAITALAELYAMDGRGDEALALLEKIPETPETRRVAALARTGPAAAEGLDERLEGLLDRVKGDDEARQEFVDLLELLPDEDPAKADWRRRLTARLF
jgi:putative thioredoxin